MEWLRANRGQYKNQTLVQILVRDPGYFFWCLDRYYVLRADLREQAVLLANIAKRIRPRAKYRKAVYEWRFDKEGQFRTIRVRSSQEMEHLADARYCMEYIDMSLLYKEGGYRREEYARLVKQMEKLIFGKHVFVTDLMWESYFADRVKQANRTQHEGQPTLSDAGRYDREVPAFELGVIGTRLRNRS